VHKYARQFISNIALYQLTFFFAQKSISAIEFPRQQAKKSPGKPGLFQTVSNRYD